MPSLLVGVKLGFVCQPGGSFKKATTRPIRPSLAAIMTSRPCLLLGFGNPLLDLEVHVDECFLKKWRLNVDDAILCDQDRLPIFDEIVNSYPVQYVAGGSTQNSMRVAQWMIGQPGVVGYFGCIGKDRFGRVLKAKADEVGLKTCYQIHPTEHTGTCAVCLSGTSRSMCTRLAAAVHFSVDHVLTAAHEKMIQAAEFIYIAGFFMSSSLETIRLMAEQCLQFNKCFMMNLSAPFIASKKKEFDEIIPYVDVLFGNEEEAMIFAKSFDFKSDSLVKVAEFIATMPKLNTNRARMVIITQGANPVYVAKDGELFEYAVPEIGVDKIVDTNGAGDAFVGGFLSQYVHGKALNECMDAAMWAANVIIQRSGCSLPQVCEYGIY